MGQAGQAYGLVADNAAGESTRGVGEASRQDLPVQVDILADSDLQGAGVQQNSDQTQDDDRDDLVCLARMAPSSLLEQLKA
jgi:hypothetical protein